VKTVNTVKSLLDAGGLVKASREEHSPLLKPRSETGLSDAVKAGEALVTELLKEDDMTKYQGA